MPTRNYWKKNNNYIIVQNIGIFNKRYTILPWSVISLGLNDLPLNSTKSDMRKNIKYITLAQILRSKSNETVTITCWNTYKDANNRKLNMENTNLLLTKQRYQRIKILYFVLNYSPTLQMKYYLLLYTTVLF